MARNRHAKRIDDHVFMKWDIYNSWALGVLTADGGFSPKARPNEFSLYNTDYDLLVAYRDVFRSEKRVELVRKAKKANHNDLFAVRLSSKTIAEFLKDINGFGNKHERNPFRYVPEPYKWSFIKGMFDGDGCIYKGKFKMAGKIDLITEMNEWITKAIGKERINKVTKNDSKGDTMCFSFGKSDSRKIFELMHEATLGTYESKKYLKFKEQVGFEDEVAKSLDIMDIVGDISSNSNIFICDDNNHNIFY